MGTDSSLRVYSHKRSAGMFLLRLATGAIFVAHGWMKWHSIPMVAGFFGTIGLSPAVDWAWFIAGLEIVGGVALIFGLFTRLFGLLLAIEMVVAIFLTGIGKGFHAHEFEILLAAASLAIAFAGSGRWSVYSMECRQCGEMHRGSHA